MPTPSRRVPIDAIREAARLAVEAGSLRAVAREVGMSPMGLRHFLDGRSPYAATARKLTAWYAAHQAAKREFSAEAARAGLVLLLDGIPEGRRDAASARLLGALAQAHADFRSTPPQWLDALRTDGAKPEE